ncbi:MAG: branched-chain amino acid ABC transporter permease [Deltaproteobacteria bacterium]|nr:branched-chain amino acid ABC transporter permease [Deltaproteobacteria bacterium]MBW2137862.1 branched-chain amino acid ABC transporter permease [Deltaproteobacteria bacterium]
MIAQLLTQTLVNGINVGAMYGLIAVGLSLTFGVMKILNVAHGEFLMLGGYVAFWLFTLIGLDPFLSLPLVGIGLFLLGAICYKIFFASLARFHEEAKVKNSLLVAFGLFLIVPQVARALWTSDERAITPAYSGESFAILGIRIGYVPAGGLLVAVVVILGLHLLLTKTYFGKSVRATTENWKAAKLMGINVERAYLFTFALGTALAGLAGVLVGMTQAVTPDIGMPWTLKALIVVVLAGIGSVGGAFFAGLLLGIIEAVSAVFMGPYTVVLGLVIFLLILMFRPQGLFGKA